MDGLNISQSAPQFAHQCIGAPDWTPPIPKRGDQFGSDPQCWLCGGLTNGVGWPQRGKPAFDPVSFTNVNAAAAPTSQTVCHACVYLGTNEGWREFVTRTEGEPPASTRLGWRNYSHVFSPVLPNGHRRLGRSDLRDVLLAPPDPPFVLCIALSGQKHLIFRSSIGYNGIWFPVQVEEETVHVRQFAFAACLSIVETLLDAGFTRDEILTGQYQQHRIAKAGIRNWGDLDAEAAVWRNGERSMFRLAIHVARRTEHDDTDAQPAADAAVHAA